MSVEKLLDAIGNISDKYIEENIVIKPIVNCENIHLSHSNKKLLLQSCACLMCIIITVSIVLLLSFYSFKSQPFVITAYAISDNGSLNEKEVAASVTFPLTVLETKSGKKGFLFSLEYPNIRNGAPVTVITDNTYEEIPMDLFMISGIELNRDKIYFYFANDSMDNSKNNTFSFSYTDGKEETVLNIIIQITESDGRFYGVLQELNSYPHLNK